MLALADTADAAPDDAFWAALFDALTQLLQGGPSAQLASTLRQMKKSVAVKLPPAARLYALLARGTPGGDEAAVRRVLQRCGAVVGRLAGRFGFSAQAWAAAAPPQVREALQACA